MILHDNFHYYQLCQLLLLPLSLDSFCSCLESDLHLCEQSVLTQSDLTGHSAAVSIQVTKD